MEKELRIAIVSQEELPEFRRLLTESGKVRLDFKVSSDAIRESLDRDELDFVIRFASDFSRQVADKKTGSVTIYYKGSASDNQKAISRLRSVFHKYEELLLERRLQQAQLELSFVKPFLVSENDISSIRQKIGQRLGGMFPYFFVIFCFMGAMYPAIDLAAGEKERGTMETLLVSPAGRGQIVIGKFLVVTLSGVFTAVASVFWLYLVLSKSSAIPREVISGVLKFVEWQSLALLFVMIIPLCAFFAAIMLAASVFAKSYKEAQSIIGPMNFIVIIPVLIGIFPGISLNHVTALIPILNISLATKEIMAGTISPLLMAEVIVTLCLLAALGLLFCRYWFSREDVLFRGV
jgi:sodium transport system permease protein